MPRETLTLRKFTLPKHELARLSAADRELFFLSGHILNELNSLNKVFGWCLRSGSESQSKTVNVAQGMQSMIYARVLAGKLWEAWEALRATWFASRRSPMLEQRLHEDSMAALTEIKKYFSHSNIIFDVRNSFAFHYSAAKLAEKWEAVAEGDGLQIVLGGTIGNNIDLAAETIANAALFNAANKADLEAGMAKFLDEVQKMASHLTTFLEGVTLVFLQDVLGTNFAARTTEEQIDVQQSFAEVQIPYFCAPDCAKGA